MKSLRGLSLCEKSGTGRIIILSKITDQSMEQRPQRYCSILQRQQRARMTSGILNLRGAKEQRENQWQQKKNQTNKTGGKERKETAPVGQGARKSKGWGGKKGLDGSKYSEKGEENLQVMPLVQLNFIYCLLQMLVKLE